MKTTARKEQRKQTFGNLWKQSGAERSKANVYGSTLFFVPKTVRFKKENKKSKG